MGILDKIKKEIKRSSSSFNEEFYLKDGDKAKVRFIRDFEEAVGIKWHDKYKAKIDTPCLEYYGQECKYCNGAVDDLRTRETFVWLYIIMMKTWFNYLDLQQIVTHQFHSL